jgi:predicted extracellular nuclease
MASKALKEELRIAFKLGDLKKLVDTLGGTSAAPKQLAADLIRGGLFASETHEIKIKQLEQVLGTAVYNIVLDAYLNEAPMATNDSLAAVEELGTRFSASDLLANDTDADGDTLRITAVGDTVGGTATLNADGTVSFKAAQDFAGQASFSYTVSDGNLFNNTSNKATAYVQVAAVNDAPVASSSPAEVHLDEDAGAVPLQLDVLTFGPGGGADEAAQTLSVTVTALPDAALGRVVLADGATAVIAGQAYSIADLGGMRFATSENAHGSATFKYEVRDSGGTENGGIDTLAQEVVIAVRAVNDLPEARPDLLRAADAGETVFTSAQLLGNDSDADGDALSITSVQAGVGGSVTLKADGSISFMPAAGHTGAASFSYTVSDGQAQREAAVVVDVTTRISAIQGEGAESARVKQSVLVEARVTAWAPDLRMFWIQDERADRDGNDLTSEGIAVYYGSADASPVNAASLGDIVRFQATVSEYKANNQSSGSLTQLSGISGFTVVADGTAADIEAPDLVTLPVATASTLERYEGMLVEVTSASAKMVAADTYTFGRYGEIAFYADEVPEQFTQDNLPDAQANAAYLDLLARSSIQLEDRSSAQNPSLEMLSAGSMIERNGAALSAANFVRVGDSTASLTGILSFDRGVYELQPVEPVNLSGATRPLAPNEAAINATGTAEIRVASFNVLNYFTSLQRDNTTADNFTTPVATVHEPRGANTEAEFARQQAKLVEAITGTGADVLGLMEMQNNGFGEGSAIDSLVDALNAKAGAGAYAYISAPYADDNGAGEPTAGGDAIMVAIIYKTATVKPLGQAATPDKALYSAFATGNRPPVAQTFSYLNDETRQFTLVVNHFKSKGDGTAKYPGDADSGDGQGAFNATRLEAAVQLSQWLATNPTGASDGDYLLVGDLNSYAKEDPVRFLTGEQFDATKSYGGYDLPAAGEALAGGYTLLGGTDTYSYVFDGLRGSLDHALASTKLNAEVTGVDHWHINADEQITLDYNTEFEKTDLFEPNAYRSSDHDPVIVGLRLNSEAGSPSGTPPADTTAPALVNVSPAAGTSGVPANANIVLTFNEAVRIGTGSIVLKGANGAADVVIDVAGGAVTVLGGTLTINPPADLLAGTAFTLQIDAGAILDAAGNAFGGSASVTSFTTAQAAPQVFISEIHYDNAGTDTGEAIALTGVAGLSLDGWSLVLYNGDTSKVYNTKLLSGVIDNEGSGRGEVVFSYPVNGIQNGPAEGIALVNANGQVVQFLSYEGAITAIDGPAKGMLSTDIGAAQPSTSAVGLSIQLIGTTWQVAEQTFGVLNAGLA